MAPPANRQPVLLSKTPLVAPRFASHARARIWPQERASKGSTDYANSRRFSCRPEFKDSCCTRSGFAGLQHACRRTRRRGAAAGHCGEHPRIHDAPASWLHGSVGAPHRAAGRCAAGRRSSPSQSRHYAAFCDSTSDRWSAPDSGSRLRDGDRRCPRIDVRGIVTLESVEP